MSKINLVTGLISLIAMNRTRKKRTAAADTNYKIDNIAEMAKRMHPDTLELKITDIIDESSTVKSFRMVPINTYNLPVFQPGQYISIKLTIGNSYVSRAYTISSAPYEAENRGYYEICVRNKVDGFVSNTIFNTWKIGTIVEATGPHGDFFVSPIRDSKEIVGIAGGAGITPFTSMMAEFERNEPNLSLTLLYGCKDQNDILFEERTAEIIERHPERFKRINILENTGGNKDFPKGYIDASFIKKYIENPADKTFFICGPTGMYKALEKEFPKVGNLEKKQMRYEVSGIPEDFYKYPGRDSSIKNKVFDAKIIINGKEHLISASADEPLLTSIEKAGLITESRCRSGECGICRSKLKSGEVFILPDNDGRRQADRDLGYIHLCSTYPTSDLTVILPPCKTVYK